MGRPPHGISHGRPSHGIGGGGGPRQPRIVISRDMPPSEIINHLTSHGCKDLTPLLDSSHVTPPFSRGGNGDVSCSVLTDGAQVAIKALRVSFESDDEPDKLPKHAAQELYTWSKCNHPNILPLLGLVEFQGQIRMVSRWMNNGDLPEYLKKSPDVDRCDMGFQVCEGVAHLHRTGIIHGDLKGTNVLVSDNGTPMITDFGNAVLEYGTLQFTETVKRTQLTPRWSAPELMDEREVKQSREADVYALGMTILEIITGKVPYWNIRSIGAVIKQIVMEKLPVRPEECIPSDSQCGDALWNLLKDCWVFEPGQRPSASTVIERMRGITREGLVRVQANAVDEES